MHVITTVIAENIQYRHNGGIMCIIGTAYIVSFYVAISPWVLGQKEHILTLQKCGLPGRSHHLHYSSQMAYTVTHPKDGKTNLKWHIPPRVGLGQADS